MTPKFPHVVRIHAPDNLWGIMWQQHPVAWCDHHVCKSEWEFHLEVIAHPDDSQFGDEVYVFHFQHENWATQFALLYG